MSIVLGLALEPLVSANVFESVQSLRCDWSVDQLSSISYSYQAQEQDCRKHGDQGPQCAHSTMRRCFVWCSEYGYRSGSQTRPTNPWKCTSRSPIKITGPALVPRHRLKISNISARVQVGMLRGACRGSISKRRRPITSTLRLGRERIKILPFVGWRVTTRLASERTNRPSDDHDAAVRNYCHI